MDTVVAGTIAALTVDIAIYPLDTLKSRLQDPKRHVNFPEGKGMGRGLYQGIGPVLLASLPAAGAFFTTYESVKNLLAHPDSPFSHQNKSGVHVALGNAPVHLIASSVGELVSCAILTPAEILKQRAQVVNKELEASKAKTAGGSGRGNIASDAKASSSSSRSTGSNTLNQAPSQSTTSSALRAAQSYASESASSLRGSYVRGFLSLAGRNLPFTAIQFPLYEHFRARIGTSVGLKAYTSPEDGSLVLKKKEDSMLGEGTTASKVVGAIKDRLPGVTERRDRLSASDLGKTFLVAGGSAMGAGAIAAALTTPIDVAKTNIMLDQSGENKGGVFKTMARIHAREGVSGLLRGGLLRSVWTALGAGLYLGSYECGRQWWNNRG
ncbi:hypothetical protein CF327_g252 [Tilletia walkeri]|nr:hypothetical protein CF327_g252 [Tilletia walkeri]